VPAGEDARLVSNVDTVVAPEDDHGVAELAGVAEVPQNPIDLVVHAHQRAELALADLSCPLH